ncbi:hypothetical protein FM109_13130 [Vibrio casei]|nr:hypothetical protein FM109_13130 [Vibrio casei]
MVNIANIVNVTLYFINGCFVFHQCKHNGSDVTKYVALWLLCYFG